MDTCSSTQIYLTNRNILETWVCTKDKENRLWQKHNTICRCLWFSNNLSFPLLVFYIYFFLLFNHTLILTLTIPFSSLIFLHFHTFAFLYCTQISHYIWNQLTLCPCNAVQYIYGLCPYNKGNKIIVMVGWHSKGVRITFIVIIYNHVALQLLILMQ